MIKKPIAFLLAVLLLTGMAGCEFQAAADAKFGDQHFKTVIALVELQKLRSGAYPEQLKDLQFTGDWDAIAISSVDDRKLGNGHELNVVRGWIGKPTLSYPPEFWHGLGLVKSNMKPA